MDFMFRSPFLSALVFPFPNASNSHILQQQEPML